MCGIAGIFNPNGLKVSKNNSLKIKKMVMALHHRGPDEQGALLSKICHLGHARLSIIDIDNGQQPMITKKKRYAITYNGEIYNHPELRKVLIGKGYKFNTNCDTEVLLYLYQEYKEKMLPLINGQFAFGIIDFKKKNLFLARDRFGIRPCFYATMNGNFYFASSIKSILQNKEILDDFNYKAYYQLISLWAPLSENSFFTSINSLEPGYFINQSLDGFKKNNYWDLDFPSNYEERSLKEWKTIVKEKISDSVKLRLRSDVPVGSYLSGGLDSCIILDLAINTHNYPVESFSITFDDPSFDESKFQMSMTKHLSCNNHSEQINNAKIADSFEKVIRHSEQPIYRTAPAPLFCLSSLVNSKNYKVVLSGEGADEIAWGYNIFKETLIRSNLGKNKNSSKWLEYLPSLYPYLNQYNSRYINFLKAFYLKSLGNPHSPLFSHQIRISNGKNVLKFLKKDLQSEFIDNKDYEDSLINWIPKKFNKFSPLQKAQYIEMKTLLSGYLLSSQGDRMSMAHSIEGRYPFLDHNVVELFTKIPENLKLRKMNEKFILKKAFSKNIPNKIIKRPKQPYRAPEALSLISNKMQRKYFNEDIVRSQNFFDWDMISKLSSKIQKNKNISFNENFIFVNAVATTIFKSVNWRDSIIKDMPNFKIIRI